MFEEEYLKECELAEREGRPKPDKKAFINGRLVMMRLDELLKTMSRQYPPRQPPTEAQQQVQRQGKLYRALPSCPVDGDIRRFILSAQELLDAITDPRFGLFTRVSSNQARNTRGNAKESKTDDEPQPSTSAEGNENNQVQQPSGWFWFLQKLWEWINPFRRSN